MKLRNGTDPRQATAADTSTVIAAESAPVTAFESLEPRTLLAGSGLSGAYFARTNLTATKFSRIDPTINFQWAGGTPAASLGTDGFSVRWSGLVMPKFSETYQLIATSSGGVRVWINNELVIDNFADHNQTTNTGNVRFAAGQKYDVRIDYWSPGGDPGLKLEWKSNRQAREVIPTNRLFGDALDKVAPTTPAKLRAASVTENLVALSWSPAKDNTGVVAYDVYVGSSKVASTTDVQTSYTRSNLSPGTNYTFSVQAIDPAGNVSKSATTLITTAAPQNRAPSIPANLHKTASTTSSITLAWNASTDDHGVSGYRVYRNGVKLGIAPTGTSFTDTGLTAGTTYTYFVRAADSDGLFSANSSTISAATTAQQQPPPSIDPFAGISGAAFSASSGGITKAGDEITDLDDGEWVRYSNVNFSSTANSVSLDVALPPANRGGYVELHLDSATGTQIAKLNLQATGSFGTFFDQKINTSAVSGTHDLYLVFKGRADMASLHDVKFSTSHLVKIMPLGDSITQQSNASPGYRYYLYQELENAGVNFDFVGSQTMPWVGEPTNYDFDQDHEGHSGWTADQIADNVVGWAQAAQPEIVLLHIGTNDLRFGQSVSSTLDDVGRIIDNLRSVVPNVKILLAQIIPSSGFDSQVNDYNSQLPGLASSKSTGNSPITIVNQNGLTSNDFAGDGIHPNASGDQKIAQRWFDALDDII